MEDKEIEAKVLIGEIVNFFSPYVDGVLLEGSSAWDGIRRGHDIDLEFITPNFRFFQRLSLDTIPMDELAKVSENFASKALNHVLALNLEMFDLKIFPHAQEISLRFTESGLFNRICHLDFRRINQTESVLQYRLCPTKPWNIQRNFSGERIKYNRWYFYSGEERLIETPIVIVDSRGRFYPGEIIDRYLAFPKIIYKRISACQKNLKKLKIGIVKRLMLEEKLNLHRTKPALSLCLSRRDRISEKLLNQLDGEKSKIRPQISNEGQYNE